MNVWQQLKKVQTKQVVHRERDRSSHARKNSRKIGDSSKRRLWRRKKTAAPPRMRPVNLERFSAPRRIIYWEGNYYA